MSILTVHVQLSKTKFIDESFMHSEQILLCRKDYVTVNTKDGRSTDACSLLFDTKEALCGLTLHLRQLYDKFQPL